MIFVLRLTSCSLTSSKKHLTPPRCITHTTSHKATHLNTYQAPLFGQRVCSIALGGCRGSTAARWGVAGFLGSDWEGGNE